MVIIDALAGHFKPETQQEALAALAELNDNYRKCKSADLPPIEIKYVLRALRRAANNPMVAAKLMNKVKRLDADTRALLERSPEADWPRVIEDRITVFEAQARIRRPHGLELERYHCGWLRVLYQRCGKHPTDPVKLRAFVVDALDFAGIPCPDPDKHPGRMDEWIATPVDDVDPDVMTKAAQQAKRLT